ncbi:related to Endoglucanase 1 precursor [Melanopsichium pennsylvanicum]|uniref:cellulase n=2 Tax=Melanopsichium pennsylvanicum TaxID=63383 RepID=A0AAJ4XL03_9BASI
MVFDARKSILLITTIAATVGLMAPAVVDATAATMYWDCCKPSSSWAGKAPVTQPVAVCQADGRTIVTGPRRDDSDSSGCGGGSEFQCSCQQPWTDDVNPTIGYGFAAMTSMTEEENSCACYVAEFEGAQTNKIQTLFYQVINIGGDVNSGGLDILVPGMGIGYQTKGCPVQWNTEISLWGKQYGGLDRDEAGCAHLPKDLQPGCMWRMKEWGNSVNMKGTPTRVRCSKAHIDRTGCQRKDEPALTFAAYLGSRKFDQRKAADAEFGYIPDSAVCGIGGASRSTGHRYLAKGHHQLSGHRH